MATHSNVPPLLALPRELREHTLSYLVLPAYIYTSSSKPNIDNLHLARSTEKTYIDTRIYLPSHLPANVLAICKQLRQECLAYHAHILNSSSPTALVDAKEKAMSGILAERLGDEIAEECERTSDDGTLRITIEVQRPQRGKMGYFVPMRDEFSPRFLALLPHMSTTRRLKLVIWPGFDWWNGDIAQDTARIDEPNTRSLVPAVASRPDAACLAIGNILKHLPAVEELTIDVLIYASDGGRWDLPDNKWERIQPWLNNPVSVDGGNALKRVVRRLARVWSPTETEAFYTQVETRQDSGVSWKVGRKGDMRTPILRTMCAPEELELFATGAVDESFERNY